MATNSCTQHTLNVKICIIKRPIPNISNVYNSYGEVLLKCNRKEESIEMYKKSIELDPNNENDKNVLKEQLK